MDGSSVLHKLSDLAANEKSGNECARCVQVVLKVCNLDGVSGAFGRLTFDCCEVGHVARLI